MSHSCHIPVVGYAQAAPVSFQNYKERQQHYAQMKRHLVHRNFQTPPGVRQLTAGNPADYGITDDLVRAWQQAVLTNSKVQKNAIFMAFLKAGKDWAKFFGRGLHCLLHGKLDRT